MSYPYYHQVQRAHSELVSEGKIRPRTNQEEVEQDKGLLTRRAAYYVYTENDPDHGLLEKNYGNNSMGYSVDWILQKNDGVGYDVATDSGDEGGLRMAEPVNGDAHPPASDLIPRWRQPTAELAQLDDPSPIGPNPPTTSPPSDEKLDEIIEMLHRDREVQARDTASIIARDDLNTQRIIEKLDDIKDQAEETLKKFLVLWMARQADEGETPPEIGEEPPSQLLLLLLKALGQNPDVAQKVKDFRESQR